MTYSKRRFLKTAAIGVLGMKLLPNQLYAFYSSTYTGPDKERILERYKEAQAALQKKIFGSYLSLISRFYQLELDIPEYTWSTIRITYFWLNRLNGKPSVSDIVLK